MQFDEVNDSVFQFSLKHGVIQGYQTSKIRLLFKPPRPCNVHFNIHFKFTSQDHQFDVISNILPLIGVVADVPLFS